MREIIKSLKAMGEWKNANCQIILTDFCGAEIEINGKILNAENVEELEDILYCFGIL